MNCEKTVKIKTYTWTKDSHKLFDYESSHLVLNKTFCSDSLAISRSNNDVQFQNSDENGIPADFAHLCNLQKTSDGKYFLSSTNPSSPLKLVIRSLKYEGKQRGYELKVGDKIQIGRVEYFIRETRDDQNNTLKAENLNINTTSHTEMDIEESKENEPKLCRICLEEEVKDSENNDYQFISPCHCKGTSKYVHVHCLRAWLESKRQQIRHNPIAHNAQAINNFNIALYMNRNHRLNFNYLPLNNTHLALSSIFNNLGLNGASRNFQGPQLGLHNLFFNPTNASQNPMPNANSTSVPNGPTFNPNPLLNTLSTEQRLNETLDHILNDNPAANMAAEGGENENFLNMNSMPNLQSWISPFNPAFNPNNANTNNSNTMSNSSIVNNVHATLNMLVNNMNTTANNAQNPAEEGAAQNNTTNNTANPNEQAAARLTRPSVVDNHNFTNFSCDVCKENLPYTVQMSDGQEIETVKIPRPESTPYLILERISQGKEPKVISVIKGNENREVRLGRGHLCDIIISDISVSRLHAQIRYHNGKFVMMDNNSKFGTLVKLDKPVEVGKEKIGIQCGRTLITAVTKPQRSNYKESSLMLLKTVEDLQDQMQNIYFKKQPQQIQPLEQMQLIPEKRIPAQVKISSTKADVKDGESEGTLDVEEISPVRVQKLTSRSKKIAKEAKKKN